MRLRRKKVWEVAYAGWGGHEVFLHLSQGWEPFNVTAHQFTDDVQYVVWFRRKVSA